MRPGHLSLWGRLFPMSDASLRPASAATLVLTAVCRLIPAPAISSQSPSAVVTTYSVKVARLLSLAPGSQPRGGIPCTGWRHRIRPSAPISVIARRSILGWYQSSSHPFDRATSRDTLPASSLPSFAVRTICRIASARNGFDSGGSMLRPCRAPTRRTSSSNAMSLPLINWTTPPNRMVPRPRMTSTASDFFNAISRKMRSGTPFSNAAIAEPDVVNVSVSIPTVASIFESSLQMLSSSSITNALGPACLLGSRIAD